MCGRYAIDKEQVPDKHRFAAKLSGLPFEKNFDARPSQPLPIILPDAAKSVLATWASPEKEPDGKPTLPLNARQENKEPFDLAGLWRESLAPSTGELTRYFSIITTAANSAVMPYQDRMPVILTPETEAI